MRRVVLGLLLVLMCERTSALCVAADLNRPGLYAEITTPRGTLVAELYFERAPLTVTNFVGLADGTLGPSPTKPFFDGLTFHRVVPGFVIQGGDPLATGSGGPGYTFPDEFVPGLRHDKAGVLSMANSGPDTDGSQFFITLAPVNRLNYLHSVFGQVVQGLELLDQIKAGDRMSVKIIRVGPLAQTFRATPATFANLVAKTPRAVVAHFDDPDGVLPTDPPRAKAFNVKLGNVERATGLKIYGRVFESFTPETPGQRPGSAAGDLAREMKLDAKSALVVYFQDKDTWGVWVGESLLQVFTRRAGTLAELTKDGSLHAAKQELLSTAKAESDATIADAIKKATADKPVSPAQQTKLRIDAVLDALISRLESTQPATHIR